eukprot:1223093-Rhodomonas_salina.3
MRRRMRRKEERRRCYFRFVNPIPRFLQRTPWAHTTRISFSEAAAGPDTTQAHAARARSGWGPGPG